MFDFIPSPLLAGFGIASLVILAGAILSQYLDDLNRFIHAKPIWHLIFILLLVGRMILFGGSKTNDVGGVTGDAGGTNGVEIVEGGTNDVEIAEGETNGVDNASGDGESLPPPLLGFAPRLGCTAPSAPSPSTDFVLVSITTNENYSYAMPPNGSLRGTWHLSGAFEALQPLDLGGFEFPLSNEVKSYFWAHTWGKLRQRIKCASNELVAVGVPMSAIPSASRLWTATTSDDSYKITWEDFALGRQMLTTNDQQQATLSAQIELFSNGNFITRSNNVERLYHRRVPGFEEEGYGPNQDLAIEENTSAYYTIDLVVSNADARVIFTGDGASNLPDPNFIAQADETNTVELLIGKTYTINCDIPFKIVGSSDYRIDVYQHSPKTATVVWPVDIYMDYGYSALMAPLRSAPQNLLGAPLLGSPSGGPWLRVDPDWLNGTVSMPTNVCCGVAGTGGDFEFACANGDCGCGGCTISGSYTYEGYTITFGGWECGCIPHEHDDDYDFSEWGFSIPRVVFKDGALRELYVWFDPGEDDDNSGQLVLTQTKGQDKIRIWANERKTMTASQFSWPVANGVSCTYYIEGVESSGSVNDIGFELEWVKEDGPDPDYDEMTCAEVEEVRVTGNNCGSSPNPPPFTGQEPHDFNVTHSPSPDQHAVVFFKDVVNDSDFTINPFDIYIDLQLKPSGAPVGRANWFTLRPTPSSGSLSSVSSVRGRLSNPTEGGVYHIGAAFDGSPTNECNIVLPLAGAGMDAILASDIAKATIFATTMRAKYSWFERNSISFGSKWFVDGGNGDYLGRPDSAQTPSVWYYGRIDDTNKMGSVCTLAGLPIRLAKLSNLLAGYTCEKLGVLLVSQWISQGIGTFNISLGPAWQCGRAIANGEDYNTSIANMVKEEWRLMDDKTTKPWPNPSAADNWQSRPYYIDFNRRVYSPGFTYETP